MVILGGAIYSLLGFGKASNLEHIQKEAANLVSIMRSHDGEPFDATMYFASAGKSANFLRSPCCFWFGWFQIGKI